MVQSQDDLKDVESINDAYTPAVRQFTAWCRANGEEFTLAAVRRYFQVVTARDDLAASTVNVRRAAVKKRIRQRARGADPAERARIEAALQELDHDPTTRAPKVAAPGVGMDRMLTPDEWRKLRASVRSDRQACFLDYLHTTGARVSELTTVKLTDCDLDGDAVKIRVRGKGGKERFLFIPVSLFNEIRRVFGGQTWLFETSGGRPYDRTYVSAQIRKLGRAVLGRTIGAHTLRHTFATEAIKSTGKIKAVSLYLGHSTVAGTLDSYMHEELTPKEIFERGLS